MPAITHVEGVGMDFGIIYEMQRPSPDADVDEKALIEETEAHAAP